MTDYRFTLISPNLPDLVIDEPIGFADIVQGMIRNEEWHGVYFQATINELSFYGNAANFLEEQKAEKGLRAMVVFLAEERCKASDPYAEVLRGRLNFGRFKGKCGLDCRVTMPVEQEGCITTFNNRYDQTVDLDSLIAFDRITGLANYAGLGGTMTLAAQKLDVGVVGDVGPDGDHFSEVDIPGVQSGISVRPIYKNIVKESIKISQLMPINNYGTYRPSFKSPTSPVLLLDENFTCFNGGFDVDIRLKGSWQFVQGLLNEVWIRIVEAADNLVIPDPDNVILAEHKTVIAAPGPKSGTFDLSYVNTGVSLRNGYGIYTEVLFITSPFTAPPDINVDFQPETHFSVNATRDCPPTDTQVYLVNEVMSRVSEAITNNCIKVKSDYYGRVDSQPYASGVDGCGSLRVLLNGLKLRKAPDNKMFLSMKDIYDGMIRPIDNCGMGFEPNPEVPGFDWLRVEPIDYFYQDVEVLRFPYVPTVDTDVDESKHYSLIKVGYNKWEPRTVAGLDEFNSNREFRTSLETVRNTLDITSNFIAAGYVIETTRQESFAATGAADTTWDNDTFIICVDREGPYGFKVEQGEIQSPANMFSPATAYNFRITPLRNLMRHFKSVINSYANILDSAAKLFFSKGTGNYTATGQLTDDCADENAPKAENIDLAVTDFKNALDAVPLVRNENLNFRYPFDASMWSKLKNQRNGYISVQCGNGAWVKAYITELQWEVRKGEAEIKAKIKWPSV